MTDAVASDGHVEALCYLFDSQIELFSVGGLGHVFSYKALSAESHASYMLVDQRPPLAISL